MDSQTSESHTEGKLEAAERSFSRLCEEHGRPPDRARASLRVDKSRRRLLLLFDGAPLRSYPVIIGKSPSGHKKREGDQRTPVGSYFICYLNPASRFHLFMGLSYPNAEDALVGLREGVISETKCREIADAIGRRERPDWYTPLGGEVGIHGGGIDKPGTAGCIAMQNADIEQIWGAAGLGTPVEIVD